MPATRQNTIKPLPPASRRTAPDDLLDRIFMSHPAALISDAEHTERMKGILAVTGRDARPESIAIADTATDGRAVESGIRAQRGIEF